MVESREVKIAVDAMGGDFAPENPVLGAVMASEEYGIKIILVGEQKALEAELCKYSSRKDAIEIIHAEETIRMDEDALHAVRKKKKSSLKIAAELIKDKRADGLVSAGNTGAMVAIMKVIVGTLKGVERPALAILIPHLKGFSILIDVGANVDCKALHLQQFAIMGSIYAEEILKIEKPRVGLLSIGEEEIKGNELTKEVFKALKSTDCNFIGNIEGKDVYAGVVDVIVCDGFIGNIVLKVSESMVEAIEKMLREELSRTVWTKLGYALSRNAFKTFKKRLDYSEYGGAPMLGVDGIAIICHGRSPAKAIKNAIRVAKDFASHRLSDTIQQKILQSREKARINI
ncbi:MAG: phosphate acyltransferase [Candidatus Fischerbacteria bacterium RBG_13_37_8]|uniref:Phosphate acyltransferase n=1 Tax=Candidatus Fischerbacteria bacterium RBG_13_37_8 TaxID=1817863 RepID=A0A1F5VFM3_9BACT|nr:MAG: phosphate acyltransferase [Candidatus Fischerbacteria bacterium RBG_13_37_8]